MVRIVIWLAILALPLFEAALPVPEINMKWPTPVDKKIQRDVPSRLVEISCKSRGEEKEICPTNSTYEIFDSLTKAILHSEPCKDEDYDTFGFRRYPIYVEANETWLHAKIHCRMLGLENETSVSENSVTIPFLNCLLSSDACMKEANCSSDGGPKFCIVTTNGVDPCATINPNWCQFEHTTRYCPINEQPCSSMTKGHGRAWFQIWTGTCPSVTVPPWTYKGQPILFNDVVLVNSSDPTIRLKCPPGSPFYNRKFRYYINQVPKPPTVCFHELVINLLTGHDPQLFNRSLQTLDMKFITSDGAPVNFEFTAIVFGKSGIKIKWDKYDSNDQVKHVMCKFDFDWPAERGFLAKTWWTTGDKKFHEQVIRDGNQWWKMPRDELITGTHEYQCHAMIEYKTCSPYRRLDLGDRILSSAKAIVNQPNRKSSKASSMHTCQFLFMLLSIYLISFPVMS